MEGYRAGTHRLPGTVLVGGPHPTTRSRLLVRLTELALPVMDLASPPTAVACPFCIVPQDTSREVWAAPLTGNARAVILFNRHRTWFPVTIRVTWEQLGYTSEGSPSGFKAAVRDLYAGKDLGVFEDGFEVAVSAYDSVVLKVTPVGLSSIEQQQGSSGAAAATNSDTVSVRAASEEDSWRPWSHPAAAALQARMRETAQRQRARDAWKKKVIDFIKAHRYSLAVLLAAVLAACVFAIVHWHRTLLLSRYEACQCREQSTSASKPFSSAVSWQRLPTKQQPVTGAM